MRSYGQYCPIARASEILAERWTPIILRNVLHGATTFTQIAAGAPGIPRSMLTKRLRELERAGVLEIAPNPEHLDPGMVLHSWVNWYLAADRLPPERVVVRFEVRGWTGTGRLLWIIFHGSELEVCLTHPGFDEDLVVDADPRALAEWHLGRVEWPDALADGRIVVDGPPALARRLPDWNWRSDAARSRAEAG